MTSNFKVGDTVFYVMRDREAKKGHATITKIGRKYIYLDTFKGRQFKPEKLFDYHSDVKFYPNEQAYLDYVESTSLKSYIRKSFERFPRKIDRLSIEQLRRIVKIIEE